MFGSSRFNPAKGERFTARHVKHAIWQMGGYPTRPYASKYGKGLLPSNAPDAEKRKLDRLIGTWPHSGKMVRPAFEKYLEQSIKKTPAPQLQPTPITP